jgi:hypothetical protein
VRAAVLTEDGGAVIKFVEGEAVAMLRTVSSGRQEEGRTHGRVRVVRGRVRRGDGRKTGGDGGGTLLRGAAGKQQPGGCLVARMPHGAGKAWGLALTGEGPLGRRSNGRQRPDRGTRVHTVAGGAGSLTSGARLAVRGCGGERCGRAWAGRGRKWSGSSPDDSDDF